MRHAKHDEIETAIIEFLQRKGNAISPTAVVGWAHAMTNIPVNEIQGTMMYILEDGVCRLDQRMHLKLNPNYEKKAKR